MADTSKDTIYIDVDDEITSIIDKVGKSKHKILALVLPKRAAVLQSIVNMKLLKRTADEAGKKTVLITSEAGLLPLAGAVGLHVAKTLQSKPAIPPPPDMPTGNIATVEVGSEAEPVIDDSKSVGELAGLPQEPEPPAKHEPPEETIDVDNTQDSSETADKKNDKKGNKIKVPNFEKFRLRLILAGLVLVLLIVGWIFAFKVWPRATVTINTNAVSINSEISFTASTDQQTLDEKNSIVPAVQKDAQETNSQKVAATGQKNVGDKATGTVNLQNCTAVNNTVTVPAGTSVITGSITFVTKDAVVLPIRQITGINCTTALKAVSVTAQNAGPSYNIASGKQFVVSGFSAVYGSNSDVFSGGTDKMVTVVSQQDVDGAKQKITDNTSAAKKDLIKEFQSDNLFALPETILPGKQTVSTSTKVGDESTEVTVTVETNYTMLGVKRDELKKLVENDVKKQIDTSKQKLSDDGLSAATFTVSGKKSATNQTLTAQTTATAGAQINADELKKQLTGKKRGDVQQMVQQLPSVDSVNVTFSPFWVNKTPSNSGKITIIVNKQQAAGNGNNSQ